MLQSIIDRSRRIVFFGGAGVSTASGIPDFRSADGLYSREYEGLTPEMILSKSFFYLHPEAFFDFYRKYMVHPEARPNAAHRYLFELEKRDKLRGIVTQNIDGLHKAAGNTVLVIEHNLDVIKTADYIIDLGPEGGDGGGTVIAKGTPEEVAKVKRSYTGQFLKGIL